MAELAPAPNLNPPAIVSPAVPSQTIPTASESSQLANLFAAPPSAPPSQPMAAADQPVPQLPVGGSPQPSAFSQQAAELGITLPATATDAEVFDAMRSRMREMTPLAQYAQALLPHADEMNDFFSQRGQPAKAPAPAADQPQFNPEEHFKQFWDAPVLTEPMKFAIQNQMVQTDPDTGLMVAKPGFELMVAPFLGQLNHAVNWERQAVRGFFEGNPIKKTYDALRDPIERMIDDRVQKHLATVRTQDAATSGVNQFEQQNADWLYQASNVAGQKMLTDRGQQFVNTFQALKGNWAGDPSTLLGVVKQLVAGQAAPAAATPQPQAPAPAAHPRTFLENALHKAVHQPHGGGSGAVQNPDGPVPVTQRELEDLWLEPIRANRPA